MPDANLLVTYDPAHAAKAEDEVKAVLNAIGEEPKLLKSQVEGVFLLRVVKPKEAVRSLVAACKETPDQFGYTFHWIPIDKWVKSDIASMQKELADINKKMDPAKSWKIGMVKRHWNKLSTPELILKLTEAVDQPKVDLKAPDTLIKVEIIGDRAGISLLDRHELLDVPEIRKGHTRPHH
jgi:tRNA(Ser,Leu) C12 N-acetylase TAN1